MGRRRRTRTNGFRCGDRRRRPRPPVRRPHHPPSSFPPRLRLRRQRRAAISSRNILSCGPWSSRAPSPKLLTATGASSSAPLNTEARKPLLFLDEIPVPSACPTPPTMHKLPTTSVSLGNVCAGSAASRAAGVEIYPGFAAAEVGRRGPCGSASHLDIGVQPRRQRRAELRARHGAARDLHDLRRRLPLPHDQRRSIVPSSRRCRSADLRDRVNELWELHQRTKARLDRTQRAGALRGDTYGFVLALPLGR